MCAEVHADEIRHVALAARALRELGVLMTAIMVAGRSGSAFAAQIGTMKLTEEIDAMRTIGISPIEALVIPRVLAVTFMMILLGFYSSVMAIVGGAFISEFALGIPFSVAVCPSCTPALVVLVGAAAASGSPLFGGAMLISFAIGRAK